MVDQIAIVPFTTPAAPGTLNITDPRITETCNCGVLLVSGSDSDGTDNTHAIFGIGFFSTNPDAAATQHVAIGLQIENGVVAVDAGFRNPGTACINVPAGTDVATPLVVAVFTTAIPGGVQLTFSTTTVQVKGVALLFAGLTESVIRQIQPSSAGLDVDCQDSAGGAGTFEPDLLLWLTHDHPGGSVNEAEGQWSLGFTINDGGSPPQQIASFFNVDETSPTDADGVARTDVSFGWLNLTTRAQETGGVTTFDASGFHASSSIVGGIKCSFLAIKFSGPFRAAIAQMAVAASTGIQGFNAFGFTPDVVLGLSSLLAATDTLTDGATASAGGYFLTGRYGSRAYTFRQDEGVTLNPTTTLASSRQEDVALLMYDDTGTVVQRAAWAGGTGAGGFQLDFSVGSAVGVLTALGIQLIPNPPLPQRRIHRPRRARARYRLRPIVVGGSVVGPPPMLRGFWKAVARIRRAALMRLRKPFPIPTAQQFEGFPTTEDPKGRIFSPGGVRGRITGPGVATPELDT